MKLTPARVALYTRLDEQVSDAVSSMFSDYCKAKDIHVAYGVREFEIGEETIHITQDTSAFGRSNYEFHQISIKFLYMSSAERFKIWSDEVAEEKKRKQISEIEAKHREIERLQKRLSKLISEV